MNNDLKIIKKKYSEKMMHLCRELFPTLLETPGLLSDLMLTLFEPSRFLDDDIIKNNAKEKFKNYIYSFVDSEEREKVIIEKTPSELLSDAGYYLYECKTEEDIQSFKKYYALGEELCTFDGGRLNRCYVFFAIKKNVDGINRKNFLHPQREDEYGTSVLSIQFSKGEINSLSIKNRYNHNVSNPDATFSNNLDNIIPGLTDSFEREYNLNLLYQKNKFNLPGYVQANNGKIYKYNYEINNIYYCPNNIIIDNFEVISKYDAKEKYIIVDYFIIDLSNKKVELYDKSVKDSFIDELKNIDKINVTKSSETGNKVLEIVTLEGTKAIIELDKNNKIKGYYNKNITKIDNNFLSRNKELTNLDLPNIREVGDNFLLNNLNLTTLNLPNLIVAGNNFLDRNTKIANISLPKLTKVGNNFLYSNLEITDLDLTKLTQVGEYFLYNNVGLSNLNVPNLIKASSNFLYSNTELKKLNFPSITEVGSYFLYSNKDLMDLSSPFLTTVGYNFLYSNIGLISLDLPNLIEENGNFLSGNKQLATLNIPKLVIMKNNFLENNIKLTSLNLSNLIRIENNVLMCNTELAYLNAPKLKEIGDNFLYANKKLRILDLPSLIKVGHYFLYLNDSLETLNLQNLTEVGMNFLSNDIGLISINLPNLSEREKYRLPYLIQEKLLKSQYKIYEEGNLTHQNNNDYQTGITKIEKMDDLLVEMINERIQKNRYEIKEYPEISLNNTRRKL